MFGLSDPGGRDLGIESNDYIYSSSYVGPLDQIISYTSLPNSSFLKNVISQPSYLYSELGMPTKKTFLERFGVFLQLYRSKHG